MACRDHPARSSSSVLLGITEASPELIAYVAVQVCCQFLFLWLFTHIIQARFALSGRSSWTNEDSKFDRFYFKILRIINNSQNKWCSPLLHFWNWFIVFPRPYMNKLIIISASTSMMFPAKWTCLSPTLMMYHCYSFLFGAAASLLLLLPPLLLYAVSLYVVCFSSSTEW